MNKVFDANFNLQLETFYSSAGLFFNPMDAPSFSTESIICGYHEYKSIWAAAFSELLSCEREIGNSHYPFAVGVIKEGSVVGHIP